VPSPRCSAVLTITGQVQVWEVYALTLAGGCVFVVDSPGPAGVRQ